LPPQITYVVHLTPLSLDFDPTLCDIDSSDFITLHSVIIELTEAGAHMDTVNSHGETPFEAATTGVAEIILRTQTRLSLKCMAAKAVKAYGLTYQGCVPRSLESFIELHGPGVKQG
jgi:Fem-1 homolog b